MRGPVFIDLAGSASVESRTCARLIPYVWPHAVAHNQEPRKLSAGCLQYSQVWPDDRKSPNRHLEEAA